MNLEEQVQSSAWPEVISPQLAQLFSDVHMIRHLEGQSAEQARSFQLHRIADLVRFLVKASPWWRDRLPSDGRNFSLLELPILTRVQFREFDDEWSEKVSLPKAHGKKTKNSTSGSSGTPSPFYTTTLHQRMVRSHYWYDHQRQGRDQARTIATILPRIREHEGEHIKSRQPTVLGGGLSFERRQAKSSVEAHARWVSEIEPDYLCVIPSVLDGILSCYEEGHVPAPRIDQVATMAETVTPALRERAASLLGASIRDRYSCEEIGPIAFQCPKGDEHYHVALSNVLVEIVDDMGARCPPGQVGRVIVTGLHNWASPTIRYELGDMAAMHPSCPCGFSHPVMTKMMGRKRFLIRLPSGEHQVAAVNARHWLAIAPFLETRLTQISQEKLVAEVVLNRPVTAAERGRIVDMLTGIIGAGLTYEVEQVEKIEWAPTHKNQGVVSLL